MIDGVILVAVMVPVFIGIAQLIMNDIPSGTKGIKQQEYITKSGEKHTALKEREEFIV
tara:strand:+ start:452 stop:625 length:174 start_codon:yes stop_codon:yes gene_type:complete